MCARFLSNLLLLYIGRVHGSISGCTVLWEVHPASAQNKSLISDTDFGKSNGVLGHFTQRIIVATFIRTTLLPIINFQTTEIMGK